MEDRCSFLYCVPCWFCHNQTSCRRFTKLHALSKKSFTANSCSPATSDSYQRKKTITWRPKTALDIMLTVETSLYNQSENPQIYPNYERLAQKNQIQGKWYAKLQLVWEIDILKIFNSSKTPAQHCFVPYTKL